MIRVKYSNVLYIDGLTEKQEEQIKDELTIVNPKYLSAMKYSNNINYSPNLSIQGNSEYWIIDKRSDP